MASERSERARFCFGFGFVLGDYLLGVLSVRLSVLSVRLSYRARGKWI